MHVLTLTPFAGDTSRWLAENHDEISRYVRSHVPSHMRDEVFQRVCVRTLRHGFSRPDPSVVEGAVKTRVRGAFHDVLISAKRRRKHESVVAGATDRITTLDVDDDDVSVDLRSVVELAMGRLSSSDENLLRLLAFDRSPREIAASRGISYEACRKRIFFARVRLRRHVIDVCRESHVDPADVHLWFIR